jgi:hypothetical protein
LRESVRNNFFILKKGYLHSMLKLVIVLNNLVYFMYKFNINEAYMGEPKASCSNVIKIFKLQ